MIDLKTNRKYSSQIQSVFSNNETHDNDFLVLGHTLDNSIVAIINASNTEYNERLKKCTISEILDGRLYLESGEYDYDFALYVENNIVVYEYLKDKKNTLLTDSGFKVTDVKLKPLDN